VSNPRDETLELVGAETPPVQPPKYQITPRERALVIVEYEKQCALNFAKLGAPTKRNARAVLVAAARMAQATGVTFNEFIDECSSEWHRQQRGER
jgi:hypothetical protein